MLFIIMQFQLFVLCFSIVNTEMLITKAIHITEQIYARVTSELNREELDALIRARRRQKAGLYYRTKQSAIKKCMIALIIHQILSVARDRS